VDCRIALDVPQASRELQDGVVDVILADYHLGEDMDGLQAVAHLGTQVATLPPVVIITADGSTDLKQRARALGYPLLHKPVRPAALRALLGALARR
jgi:DNA-binding response OmpR family regulator